MFHRASRLGSALAAVGAVMIIAGAPSGALAAGPRADVFSFLYPSSQSPTDSRVAGDKAVAGLNAAGYGALDQNQKSAATALSSTYGGSDAIWVMAGHGRAGAVLFYNGSALSEVAAESGVPSIGYPMTYIRSTAGLSDVRLMVFLACDTAADVNTTLPDHGNLMNNAYFNRGVDSTVGFTGSILWEGERYWSDMFFTNLSQGKSISTAASNAADYVMYTFMTYGGFDTGRVYNGSPTVLPAGFGK